MDSIFARIKRLPRKAALEARKSMKQQANDAYESDSDHSESDSWTPVKFISSIPIPDFRDENGAWTRSMNKNIVTVIPSPGFREITTRSSSRLAAQ
jgi:hypothetical protein